MDGDRRIPDDESGTTGQPDLDDQVLGTHFLQLGAALATESGERIDPARVVEVAARSIAGSDHCAITLLRPRTRPQSLGATDELPARVDAIQFDVGEGPCIDASTEVMVARTGDVGSDPRWPVFGPRCLAATGVHSMLAVRLPLGGEDQAALNFYARATDAFGDADVHMAAVVAPFAAVAVEQHLRAVDSENLHAALTTSRQIGTAVGILMASRLVTADQAFDHLRSASQQLNRKLRDVAAEVEQTGELPRSRRHDS